AAATLGIGVLEVHLTLSRESFGPDVVASVTTDELREDVRGVRFIEAMRASPRDEDDVAAEPSPKRELSTESVVTRSALPAGTVLREEHLALKKPGWGLPAERLPALIGARLARDVEADALLTPDDLEG